MLCDRCNENMANIHIKKIINGKVTEVHLCDQCAKETKETDNEMELSLKDFLVELMDLTLKENEGIENSEDDKTFEPVCSNCGMKYSEFKKKGKFGCVSCLETFDETLPTVLNKLHGSDYHDGKLPKKHKKAISHEREIMNLKDMLNKAVKLEEYEQAAELRDKIRGLEKEQENE